MFDMKRRVVILITVILGTLMIQSCNQGDVLLNSERVLLTSESGDRIAEKENVRFKRE
jgi:hypothetical protein